jgi:hypothetical protein
MTTTIAVLIPPQFAPATEGGMYQLTGVKTSIDKFTAHNSSGAVATLTVKLTQLNGVGDGSTIIAVKAIQPGTTYTFPEVVGHVLESGGTILVTASAADALSVRASGRQFS